MVFTALGSWIEPRPIDSDDKDTSTILPIILVADTDGYNLIRSGKQFLAVAKSLGPVNLFDERLGERELGSIILVGSTLEEVRARAKALEKSACPAVLVAETDGYNLIQAGERCVAVAKSLGPVNLFDERLGERELGSLILVGSNLEEIRAQAKALEKSAPPVTLVAETDGYNLIQAGERFVAVAKSLGPVSLFDERLGERELGSLILVGSNLEEVRVRAEGLESN